MISFEHKFIFIHAPKTGGESIQSSLAEFSQSGRTAEFKRNIGGVREGLVISDEFGKGGKHSPLNSYWKDWSTAKHGEWIDYFKFGVARNPWDRVVSIFFFWQQKAAPKYRKRWGSEWSEEVFAKFLKCRRGGRDLINYFMINSSMGLNYIIRFETFQRDFNMACDCIGIPHQELPHANKSRHKPYHEYYNKKTRKIVADRYKADIKYFGYKFGG